MSAARVALSIATVMAGLSSAFHFWRSFDTERLVCNLIAHHELKTSADDLFLYHYGMVLEAVSGVWFLSIACLIIFGARRMKSS